MYVLCVYKKFCLNVRTFDNSKLKFLSNRLKYFNKEKLKNYKEIFNSLF